MYCVDYTRPQGMVNLCHLFFFVSEANTAVQKVDLPQRLQTYSKDKLPIRAHSYFPLIGAIGVWPYSP